jgi:hypothetical protein
VGEGGTREIREIRETRRIIHPSLGDSVIIRRELVW